MFYIKYLHHTLYESKSFNQTLHIFNIVRSQRPHISIKLYTSDKKIIIFRPSS